MRPSEIWRRILFLFRRDRMSDELAEEMRLHKELRARQISEQGIELQEADRAARRAFGNSTLLHETSQEMWRWVQLERLWQDARYAFRLLARDRAFTAIVVIVLALGIGANAAIFSVVNTVLLRPLPYSDSDRLVQIWENKISQGTRQGPVSPYNFLDWEKQSRSFRNMAAYQYESFALTTRGAPERMPGLLVSGDFFKVFDATPLLGRTFRANEDRPGNQAVVLSYDAWHQRFNADPNIIGKAITLNEQPYSVIGVMPADFQFPTAGTEVWMTPAFDLKARSRGDHFLFAVGQLNAGVTLSQAQAEVATIAHRLEKQFPGTNRSSGVVLVSLQEQMVGGFKTGLLVLWSAVTLVLLIACANVAHLLLARSVSRQKEIAIRASLGAGRARVIRQLLTESMLLSLIAGMLGLAIGVAGIHLLSAGGLKAVPRTHGIHMDGAVFAFTVVISVLTGIIFGIVPAFNASKLNLAVSLKQTGWGTSLNESSYRLRSVLVVSELALAVVLLIGSGLLIKSFWLLQNVDPGFRAQNRLTMRLGVPEAKYPGFLELAQLYQRVIDRVAALPGVESVGATNDLPFAGSRTGTSFYVEGRPPAHDEDSPVADYRTVSPDYLTTFAIPLIKGRTFTARDNQQEAPVAIINQALAHKYWPHDNPIGRRLMGLGDRPVEIVGVIGDVKHDNLAAVDAPEIYVPQLQGHTPPWTFLVIHSHLPVQSLITAVRGAVRDVDPDDPLFSLQTMEERLSASIAPQQFNTLMLGVFAGFALVLAALGIYGVIAYAVTERTHEIGVRMALGAQRNDVLRLVVTQGLRLTVAGVMLGLAGALALSRVLSGMLYATRPTDPATFAIVTSVLLLVAIMASYVPARRATRVDPMVALRDE